MATYWLRYEFRTGRGRYFTALRADTGAEGKALAAAGFQRIRRNDINRIARSILLTNPYDPMSNYLGYNLIATPDYEPDAYHHFAAGPWIEKQMAQQPATVGGEGKAVR